MAKKLGDMRDLDRGHAVFGENVLDSADEAVQIGDVSEDMPGQEEPGGPVLVTKDPGQSVIEEIHDGRDAAFDGPGGNILGRLDA